MAGGLVGRFAPLLSFSLPSEVHNRAHFLPLPSSSSSEVDASPPKERRNSSLLFFKEGVGWGGKERKYFGVDRGL